LDALHHRGRLASLLRNVCQFVHQSPASFRGSGCEVTRAKYHVLAERICEGIQAPRHPVRLGPECDGILLKSNPSRFSTGSRTLFSSDVPPAESGRTVDKATLCGLSSPCPSLFLSSADLRSCLGAHVAVPASSRLATSQYRPRLLQAFNLGV
jgi:hypothetical protein